MAESVRPDCSWLRTKKLWCFPSQSQICLAKFVLDVAMSTMNSFFVKAVQKHHVHYTMELLYLMPESSRHKYAFTGFLNHDAKHLLLVEYSSPYIFVVATRYRLSHLREYPIATHQRPFRRQSD